MKRYASLVALSAFGSLLLGAAPTPAGAQVWKKVKSSVSERVGARKQKADSAVVKTAAETVDSTLAPGSRAVESGTEKVGTATDAALDRVERGIAGAFTSRGSRSVGDRVAGDLTRTGSATLSGLEFVPGSAELAPSSEPALTAAAKVLKGSDANFLIEGHTDASGDAAADQALSEQRAKSVKARLVALGVPTSRLFAMGYGATRPPGAPGTAGPADSAQKGSKADMAKSVAEAVVPGARLLGLGAKAVKARRDQQPKQQGQADPAVSNARIVITRAH